VLGLVLLGWLAERKMDRKAAADSTSDIARVRALKVALVLARRRSPEGGPNPLPRHRLDGSRTVEGGQGRYLLVSGNRDSTTTSSTAMREGLIKRGVPARGDLSRLRRLSHARSRCCARADVFGQAEILVISQRFHLGRALFIAHHAGIHAWGYDARDVDQPYSIVTPLRRYPSALMAYVDMCLKRPASEGGTPVVIGVDPPS
jgi:SanA protein